MTLPSAQSTTIPIMCNLHKLNRPILTHIQHTLRFSSAQHLSVPTDAAPPSCNWVWLHGIMLLKTSINPTLEDLNKLLNVLNETFEWFWETNSQGLIQDEEKVLKMIKEEKHFEMDDLLFK
ncbi:hypothetical protein DFH28DRAFT_1140410 [Melampsora americana]|nr:hypothetical protein DFH28DRAFT_1140410 [Melampsora americana]